MKLLTKEQAELLSKKGILRPETAQKFFSGGQVNKPAMGSIEGVERAMRGTYRDTGRAADSPAEYLDSLVGAPVRTAIDTALDEGFAAGLAKGIESIGKDPQAQATGEQIAEKVLPGDQFPITNAAFSTAIDVLAQVPVPGAGLGLKAADAIPGSAVIKGVKSQGKIADATQAFAERAKSPVSTDMRIKQMYGEAGEVRDAMPRLIEDAKAEQQGRFTSVDHVRQRRENDAYFEEMRRRELAMPEVEAQPLASQIARDRWVKQQEKFEKKQAKQQEKLLSQTSKKLQKFFKDADDEQKEEIQRFVYRFADGDLSSEKALLAAAKTEHPYIGTDRGGIRSVMTPNFAAKPTGVIGTPGIKTTQTSVSDRIDPFIWADHKWKIGKNLLRRHGEGGKPVVIHTSSDLIGRDDYISVIPEGSAVNLYLPPKNQEAARVLLPGNPSRGRLERAAERLRAAGVNVIMHEPTVEDLKAAAKSYQKNKGLKFGGFDSEQEFEEYLQKSFIPSINKFHTGGIVSHDGKPSFAGAADALLAKGLISKDTFAKISQRFAAGGMVDRVPASDVDMMPQSELPTALSPLATPQGESPLMRNTRATSQDIYQEPVDPMVDVMPAKPQQSGYVEMAGSGSQQMRMPNQYPDMGAEKLAKQNLSALENVQKATSQVLQGASKGFEDFYDQEMQKQAKEEEWLSSQNDRRQSAEMQYAKVSLDPDRFYKNMSTGQRVTAALAIALGGGDAYKILQDAAQRDFMAQKSEAEKLGDQAKLERNIYQDMLDQFKDRRMARAATLGILAQGQEMQLKALAEQTRNVAAREAAVDLIRKIQGDYAKHSAEFATAAKLSPMLKGEIEFGDSVNMLDKDTRERVVRLPNNRVGLTTSPENAKFVNKTLPAVQDIKQLTDELIRLSGPGVGTERVGRAQSVAAQLLLAIKDAKQLGALDAGAITVGEMMIGDPTTFNIRQNEGKLKSFKEQTLKSEHNLLNQYIINYDRSSNNVGFQPDRK